MFIIAHGITKKNRIDDEIRLPEQNQSGVSRQADY